ncbi:MAG: hypothetical protein GKS03_05290 [Alphaproteobacteria bacterium]|nr:hypothetical protein [Alphaproteobacteria bacterium]
MKWILIVAALAPGSDEKGVDALTLQTIGFGSEASCQAARSGVVRQVEDVMEPDVIKQFVTEEIRKSGDIPNPEVFADLFLGRVSAACYRAD